MEKRGNSIVILDYGSQYAQLIARRIREAGVYCDLLPWMATPDVALASDPAGFILSGGPNSVYDDGAPTLPGYVIESGAPILGICYGMQLLCHSLGGVVARSSSHEYGPAELHATADPSPLFNNWPSEASERVGRHGRVWMSHGDKVDELPLGFATLATSDNSPYAAAADLDRGYFTVQFHPEVAHTVDGNVLIENFVFDICGCQPDWTPANFVDEQVRAIQEQVGDGNVVLGLSGGVDSAVAAALIHKAIGDRLVCVYVDHGLMRKGESQAVISTFRDQLGMRLVAVNAVEEFLGALSGVEEPETKRRIIGQTFISIFEREALRLEGEIGHIAFLGQGTIYPDVIESAGGTTVAKTIKTHHNVGGLPEGMALQLVEPLRRLFKDEVRRVGLLLNLPDSVVWRQPFPGPGLAIRCLGEVTWEKLESLRESDAIFRHELDNAGLTRSGTQQAFTVLLPVKTVGVMGDNRTYENVVALRAVTSDDFMTADWARLPYEVLAITSQRIVNEVEGVNRVVYDVTSKPPGTIEWE